jgi:hypothetical protein
VKSSKLRKAVFGTFNCESSLGLGWDERDNKLSAREKLGNNLGRGLRK